MKIAKNTDYIKYIFKLFIVSFWAITGSNLDFNIKYAEVLVFFMSEGWYEYWIAIPAIFIVLVTLFSVLNKKWNSKEKSFAVLISAAYIFFNYTTHIYIYIQSHILAHAILAILFFCIWFFLVRDQYPVFRKLVENVIFSLMIILSIVYICIIILSAKYMSNERVDTYNAYFKGVEKMPTQVRDIPFDDLPDIYIITPDAYAGNESLKRLFSFDNKLFLNELKNKGFYLPENSYSNYPKTEYSISSNFNLTYINKLIEINGDEPNKDFVISLYKNKNRLNNILKNKGYEILPDMDLQHNSNGSYPKWANFIGKTPGVKWLDSIYEFNLFQQHAASVLMKFNIMSNFIQAESAKPKFSSLHVISPHPPFLFKENGDSIEEPWYTSVLYDGYEIQEDYSKYYVGQLKFINNKMMSLIDKILNNAKRSTVILLLGDHGSRSRTDWKSVEKTDLKEAYKTISAVYFSDGNYQELYPTISPVNIMRLTARKYLGVDTPNIKDEHYYVNFKDPLNFHLITEELY